MYPVCQSINSVAPYLAPLSFAGEAHAAPRISSLLAAEIVTGADRRQIRPCQPCSLTGPAVHQALFLAILGGLMLRANCSRKYEARGSKVDAQLCRLQYKPEQKEKKASHKHSIGSSTVSILDPGFAPAFSLLFFSFLFVCFVAQCDYTSAAVGGFAT